MTGCSALLNFYSDVSEMDLKRDPDSTAGRSTGNVTLHSDVNST